MRNSNNSKRSSAKPPPSLDDVRAALAERRLRDYIKSAWPILEPATPYLHNWHIDAIAEYLEAVTAGQILRLLINMPPRHMKSIAVSVMWPTWEWIRRPDRRWLFASYSATLSTKHSVDRRTLIQSDWYQAHWGTYYHLANDQNLKTEYLNDQRGVMVATSVGGSATGKGGSRLVVDDPHNPLEAQSDVQRRQAITFFDQTLSNRLDDPKRDAIVVVMQRLHEADLSARCLEMGYTHLSLPAEAETRTVFSLPSGREIVREAGSLLWPERLGAPELTALKLALGSYGYAGQYQQRPAPTEGGHLKRQWWRFWYPADRDPPPPVQVRLGDGTLITCAQQPRPAQFTQQIQSWDMAFKETADSDYVVGQVWGRLSADCYLLDQVRERLDFVRTLAAVEALSLAWPLAVGKLVEDRANGPAVITSLRSKVRGLIPIQPDGGKIARVAAVSPTIEAGNVYLPHPAYAPWVAEFINECASFPNAAHDDQVDTMTQALMRFTRAPERAKYGPDESIY